MTFEDIYRDKDGVTEEPYAAFDIPFLTNPKDKDYDWYDDRTYIMDLEKFIPDFRRKLAARLIILAGRKNSEGEYCYYLPYSNNPIADIEDDTIKGLVDEHGFVIALPDVPMKTERGGIIIIIMDLHVTYLTGIIFWTFNSKHQSKFVFHLTQDTIKRSKTKVKKSAWRDQGVKKSDEPPTKNIEEGESYEVTDLPDGGKSVSMNVIVPEDGDEDFDFYSYECRISDKKQIELITEYMKRFEDGKEYRSFLMIGRPCLGLDNLDIFYSLDGEIIFNFIFDKKIKDWIREAGFVLGKVKSYKQDSLFADELSVTLSVSKRKSGETLFKQASDEAMDYLEERAYSLADNNVKMKVVNAVNDYLTGKSDTPYKVIIIPKDGYGICTNLDGDEIASVFDDEIVELAESSKGAIGYIADIDYDEDDAYISYVDLTIRVSRSIPRLTLETSADSVENSSSAINDFFPIFGFTLGRTTWKDAKNMGYEIMKDDDDDQEKYIDVGDDVQFVDYKGEGVFNSLLWGKYGDDFPPLWKSIGFSWELSYDEWMAVFKSLDYDITITEEPSQKDINGCTALSAKFNALSPDKTLLFRLWFDHGREGYYTSSPKTLDTIIAKYIKA